MIGIKDRYTTPHNPTESFVKLKFTEADYDQLAKRVVDGEISLTTAERQLETKYSSDRHGPKYFWNAYFRHAMPVPEFVNIRVNIKSQKELEAMKQGEDDTIANVVARLLMTKKRQRVNHEKNEKDSKES